MLIKLISDLLVFLSSTVKFALGASFVVTGDMGLWGTVANFLGGITGVVIFTYLGSYMRIWLIKHFPDKFSKKFSRSSRFIVKIKTHFGLVGVAFLTPILFSIPVGVMLALDLTSHKRKVLTSMIFSCIFWSAVFFVPYFAFNIDVIGWVKHQF